METKAKKLSRNQLLENIWAIASLITDGCNMGIKSLHRYLNQYPAADKGVKHLTKQIISTEEKLLTALQRFL